MNDPHTITERNRRADAEAFTAAVLDALDDNVEGWLSDAMDGILHDARSDARRRLGIDIEDDVEQADLYRAVVLYCARVGRFYEAPHILEILK